MTEFFIDVRVQKEPLRVKTQQDGIVEVWYGDLLVADTEGRILRKPTEEDVATNLRNPSP